MKLVVVSDNHRDQAVLTWIVSEYPGADHYLHVGDSEMSEEQLTSLGFYGVRGNYPFEPKFPNDLLMEFAGVKTFITHGHKYGVKLGIYGLVEAAISLNVHLVLYGHTHQPKINEFENILFVNPGSASSSRSVCSSFAIITIEQERILIEIIECYTKKVLSEYSRFLDLR